MLTRIMYVSRAAVPFTAADVAVLAARAARANEARDVTGLLMASGGLFFQILEGPPATIEALLAQIRADPRHRDVVVLSHEEGVTARRFERWSMRRLVVDDESRARFGPLHALLEGVVQAQQHAGALATLLGDAIRAELQRQDG
jgi:hypothetical protein